MARTEIEVINRLARWAEEQSQVRAMLLTSTRARPDAVLDRLSDYDVIVVVVDVDPFVTDDAWVRWYGPPLVMFRDTFGEDGVAAYARLVIYEDGTKFDYIWAVLQRAIPTPAARRDSHANPSRRLSVRGWGRWQRRPLRTPGGRHQTPSARF
jgi:hypothetical protein